MLLSFCTFWGIISMYNIREAHEEDREQTVEMLINVFKDIDGFEDAWVESWQNYMNKPENEDWNYVATLDGKVVANLAFFANNNNSIHGRSIRFGGVWAVATHPDHRRKGLLKRIYVQAFQRMKEKGIVLSILEPSPYSGAQPAYERLGYAVAERRVCHEFHPDGLRQIEGSVDITSRILKGKDEWRLVTEIEKTMSRFGSRVFTWSGFLIPGIQAGNFHIFEREGIPVGCVNLAFENSPDGKAIHMMNTYYSSNDVIPSILELVKHNSGDVSKVIWNCGLEVPIQLYFNNIHRLNSKIDGTMMMRVVDFEGYFSSMKVPAGVDLEISLELQDRECPWNTGIFILKVGNGSVQVTRSETGSHADLKLNPYELSTLVSGLNSPAILQELGIIPCSPEVSRNLSVIFPKDSFISYFRF